MRHGAALALAAMRVVRVSGTYSCLFLTRSLRCKTAKVLHLQVERSDELVDRMPSVLVQPLCGTFQALLQVELLLLGGLLHCLCCQAHPLELTEALLPLSKLEGILLSACTFGAPRHGNTHGARIRKYVVGRVQTVDKFTRCSSMLFCVWPHTCGPARAGAQPPARERALLCPRALQLLS